jgi:MFS family permease
MPLLPEPGPQRTLALAAFINTAGTGLFVTSSALFFTRSVGLPVSQVELGLTIAALAGLTVGIPAGRIADRWGPRRAWVTTLCVEAAAMSAFVAVRRFWPFLAVACLSQVAGAASQSARMPVVRRLGRNKPIRLQAYLRSVANLGVSLGAMASGAAIQADTRGAYLALVLGDAGTFVVCAALLLFLPAMPPLPVPDGARPHTALRDRPFLAVTFLSGIMSLQTPVLTFALPLWIVDDTRAPRWFVGAIVVINTALVVCFQMPASRRVTTPRAAGRAVWAASVAIFAGCALMAAAAGIPTWAAVAVLAAAVAAHTIGELRNTAASMELTIGLAPEHAQGEYGGMFSMGFGMANAIGPVLLGVLCLGWKGPGWLLLGGIFMAAGLSAPVTVRWAERSRPFPVPVAKEPGRHRRPREREAKQPSDEGPGAVSVVQLSVPYWRPR